MICEVILELWCATVTAASLKSQPGIEQTELGQLVASAAAAEQVSLIRS